MGKSSTPSGLEPEAGDVLKELSRALSKALDGKIERVSIGCQFDSRAKNGAGGRIVANMVSLKNTPEAYISTQSFCYKVVHDIIGLLH